MRKLFLGIPVFIIAFVVGYATGHFYLPQLLESNPTPDTESSLTMSEEPAPSVSRPPYDPTAAPSVDDRLETIDEVNDEISGDEPQKYSIKLLEVGEDVDWESASAKNDETWRGLFEEDGKYSVRSTKLKIKEDRVDVSDSNKPILLLKNAPMVREGKVLTSFRGVDDALYDSLSHRGIELADVSTKLESKFDRTFKFGNKTYVLRVDEARNKDGQRLLALFLYEGSNRQVLFTQRTEYNEGTLGYLYWIGDLDHDGLLDIYCNLYGGGDSAENVLFLSSKAKSGNLVGKAAELWFVDNC